MSSEPKQISRLSSAKRELLSVLKAKRGWRDGTALSIPRRAECGPCALSFAQQRLWFLDQLEPGSSAYNIPVMVRILGPLNITVLERCCNEIVRRHETLRTFFTMSNGVPVQTIVPALTLAVEIVDLEHLTSKERDHELSRLANEEARQPFQLNRVPLLRVKVLRLHAEEYVMFLTVHHIISDGWSMHVLMQELTTLYAAFSESRPSPLSDLPVQYADFAVWQRERLQDDELKTTLDYWKQQLAEHRFNASELPTDYPRPAIQTFRGAQCTFELSPQLTEAIRSLSKNEGVTLFMTLLAGWQALLARYTGAGESVVGTAIANRRHAALEGLIGFFVNTLVMRSTLPPQITFGELLRQVQEVALGAYAHQDLPFEKLVETLQPERSLSQTPLFQVMFALQTAPAETFEVSGLELSVAGDQLEHLSAKFDLFLALEERHDCIKGTLRYNADLFAEAKIRRLMGHYERLLASAAAEPQRCVWALPLLNQVERQQVIVEWNDIRTDYPDQSTVHELFTEQVGLRPDSVAVVYGDEQLSYGELNTRTNRLAHYLQRIGVGPEVRVGVCLERSSDLLVTLLAILKAGGAYVPLDPLYPESRLHFMIEDCAAPVLITESYLRNRLPKTSSRIVALSEAAQEIAQQRAADPASNTTAESLCYVMYTSGSSGRPKGVGIIHRNVVRLVKDTNYASFSPDEVCLQFAPISFDASTFEIWGSLLNGGRLVLMPPQAPSLGELGRALVDYRITTLWLTAGLFHQMVEQQLPALSTIRQLLAGGDVLSPAHVKKILAASEDGRLINGYGPTETTTFACCHVLHSGESVEGSVPIGRPIANTTSYILDVEMHPVPVGVIGELYIGGDGVGRGYLNRSELTAEKFVPNPFSNASGARLYRTGDRVRYLPDGQIEFCGRLDEQVKLRGFRIEIGEIEAALRQHPAVLESVVTVRQDQAGDKRLVAYVVAASHTRSQEFRRHLRSRLPEYMVPSSFVILDELPLTPNGKVDRRALPPPETERPELFEQYVAPRTPVEEILAGIWSEVLNIESVGVHDNFFEIGGHSLLATQVMSRMREIFPAEVSLKTFFESPTIAQLAQRVAAPKNDAQQREMPPIERIPRNEPLSLSFSQRRLWFIDQLDPGNAAYNIPLAMRLTGPLDHDALAQSLSEIMRRHESLRTSFPVRDGQPIQWINPPQALRVPITDLTDLQPDQREARARELAYAEARRTFKLATGPLFRVSLLRLAQDEHIALVTMHHIVADGWSLGVLVKEVAALYEVYRQGKESPLVELPVQYADFAVWQRKWFAGELLELHLDYWRKQLRGATVLELPADRPRPTAHTFAGAVSPILINQQLTESLKQLSRRESVTLFMTLLAAFQTLMYRMSGQEDVLVGTGIANRNRKELEGLIGCLINTLALRTDLSGDPTFREVLARVREVTLGAYAHQDLPFEKLVEELEPERDLGQTPLYKVMFSLQNTPLEKLELSGLSIEPFETSAGTSHVELILMMQEVEQGIRGTFEYNTDLFDAATITRIADHFTTLLDAVVAHPDWRVLDLQLELKENLDQHESSSVLESEDHEEQFSFQR